MKYSSVALGLVGLAVIAVIGFAAYTYLVRNPPDPLVELVSKMDPPPPLPQGDEAPLKVADGFRAIIFSREVPGARVMTRDPGGTMLVSLTKEGKVVALLDANTDNKADRTVTILEGLRQPHGILVRCRDAGSSSDEDACTLYVAETGELKSYRYDADTYRAAYEETLARFPAGDGHFTRTLLMHPDDNRLLISVGSSCNVCREEDPMRATVQALDLTTKELSTFASGLRNTVFMTVDPVTSKVWGTDNGRDVIGDDIPPDEVNILEEGNDYGWPLCYGNNVHDTAFDTDSPDTDPCTQKTPSHIELQAHSAALGLAFIPEEGWDKEWQNDLLIAYHGSWNRSVPTGYKVVRIELDETRALASGPQDFLTGFLEPNADTDTAIGRPVGVLVEENGVVYVSDDRAGAVYRVSRLEQ